jgi:ferric-chelate reductase
MSYAQSCMDGISTSIAQFTFAGGDPEDYYGTLCQLNLTTISLWAAARTYCTPQEIEAGTTLLGGYCTEYGKVELAPYSKVAPLLTDEYIAAMKVVTYDDVAKKSTLDQPVLLSSDFFEAGRRTVVSHHHLESERTKTMLMNSSTSSTIHLR